MMKQASLSKHKVISEVTERKALWSQKTIIQKLIHYCFLKMVTAIGWEVIRDILIMIIIFMTSEVQIKIYRIYKNLGVTILMDLIIIINMKYQQHLLLVKKCLNIRIRILKVKPSFKVRQRKIIIISCNLNLERILKKHQISIWIQ